MSRTQSTPRSSALRPLLGMALWCAALSPTTTASAAPALLPIEGVLTDNADVPIDGEDVELTLRLYAGMDDSEPIYQEMTSVRPVEGYFSHTLGTEGAERLSLDLFREHAAVFLGVSVGDEEEATPRMVLGSVPYAGYAPAAGDAQTLTGQGVDVLQTRLAGSCVGGEALLGYDEDNALCGPVPRPMSCGADEYLFGFDEAGAPSCRQYDENPGGDITGVAAGTGLTGGGDHGNVALGIDATVAQRRVQEICQVEDYLYGVMESGAPMCRTDDSGGDITVVTPGDGLQGGEVDGRAELSVLTTAPVIGPESAPATVSRGTGWPTIATATIDVPSAGYVLAMGKMQILADNGAPEGMKVLGGITNDDDVTPNMPTVYFSADSGTGGAAVGDTPLSATEAFAVQPGPNTFYLKVSVNARHPDESVAATGLLQLVFLPGTAPDA